METVRTMREIDRNSLPEKHLLVSLGEGSIFHYTACGLESVFVEGALFEHPNYAGWHKIDRIEEIHYRIGSEVLSQIHAAAGAVLPAQFRFMRKDMGLTLAEACTELGIDAGKAAAWEQGDGISPTNIGKIVPLFLEYRKLGYTAFSARREQFQLAA